MLTGRFWRSRVHWNRSWTTSSPTLLNAAPPSSTISLTVDHTASWLTLHVIDQGPGLDADARQRAFDRFWRAPGNRAKGSGLGLAIVAELAAESGGHATLGDRPGGGVDASIRLPTADTADAQNEELPPPGQQPGEPLLSPNSSLGSRWNTPAYLEDNPQEHVFKETAMKPRKALITSAAVAATMVSASAAMALNGGILDTSRNDGVGTLNPTMVTAGETTTSVEVPGPITIATSDNPAVTTSSASTITDSSAHPSDDSYESDDRYESHDDESEDNYESEDDETTRTRATSTRATTTMTDPHARPVRRKTAAVRRSTDSSTARQRSHPAAASRILVTGLSIAATLGLATAMATPDVPDIESSATQVANRAIDAPTAVTVAATDQPAMTTSHAS